MGIRWAPLNIPLHRRLETVAAAAWICLVLYGELVSILLFIGLIYSDFYLLGWIYLYWLLTDIDTCNRGGRSSEWARNWSWWRYLKDYFPAKLVKKADLDPDQNYLFACYPHGVISASPFIAFCSNASGFKDLFPGMKSYLVTLGGHFSIPFFHDLALALGGVSSTMESLLHVLDKKNGTGNCLALLVGGAAESLFAQPGEYKIVLKRRRGFIRAALMSGASLVPVFSFGETSVFRPFSNPEGGYLFRVQEWVRKKTGLAPMFPVGRGIFQYNFGLVPLRGALTTVVGAPIAVTKTHEPTEEQIDALHTEFTKQLVTLFESEKSKYIQDYKNTRLVIT